MAGGDFPSDGFGVRLARHNRAETRRSPEPKPPGSADHLDLAKAGRVRFPDLDRSGGPNALRPSASLLERIKVEANGRDVAYQSLIKVWLKEKVG